MKQYAEIDNLEHEKELVIYQIFNGYRVCEDNGEVAVKDDAKNYVDLPEKLSELEIRQLKVILKRKNETIKEPEKIIVNKVCSCNMPYKYIPKDAIKDSNGYWWNCICRSTLFYPHKKHGK